MQAPAVVACEECAEGLRLNVTEVSGSIGRILDRSYIRKQVSAISALHHRWIGSFGLLVSRSPVDKEWLAPVPYLPNCARCLTDFLVLLLDHNVNSALVNHRTLRQTLLIIPLSLKLHFFPYAAQPHLNNTALDPSRIPLHHQPT